MRNYLEYVDAIQGAIGDAKNIPTGAPLPNTPCVALKPELPPIVILSPHPDDEMLVGGLALRFRRQCGRRVVTLGITLGSKRERQSARWRELQDACAAIGFEVHTFGEHGLEHITPDARQEGGEWEKSAAALAEAISALKPEAVFFPHKTDANRTHMGVHLLAMDALRLSRHACMVFETEFWAPMPTPNLCAEISREDLSGLMTALSRHVGEVARNPYHLRLPAWMMDNVRRGGELVGTQGGDVPDFTFATLYHRARWTGTEMREIQDKGIFFSREQNPSKLLSLSE